VKAPYLIKNLPCVPSWQWALQTTTKKTSSHFIFPYTIMPSMIYQPSL